MLLFISSSIYISIFAIWNTLCYYTVDADYKKKKKKKKMRSKQGLDPEFLNVSHMFIPLSH